MSDVHLEFETGFAHTVNIPESDLLILAGDIFTPWIYDDREKQVFQSFFKEASEKSKDVVYIMGNHEHYGGYFVDTAEMASDFFKEFGNIHLLNGNHKVFDKVVVWGHTFWTDMKMADPVVMWAIRRGMTDYTDIKYSLDRYNPYDQKISLFPEDTINENEYARKKLREFFTSVEDSGKIPIVVTHHALSWESVERDYRLDDLSYAYANTGLDSYLQYDFPEFIHVHGHMHKQSDETIGKARTICNARGYIGYSDVSRYTAKILEI